MDNKDKIDFSFTKKIAQKFIEELKNILNN